MDKKPGIARTLHSQSFTWFLPSPPALGLGGICKEYMTVLESIHLTLLKILIRTRKRVTSMAILPGTTSGFTRKLTQLTITNIAIGRYT